MTEENKQYQLTCLFSPLLGQREIEEISQKIKKWIIAKGGSFPEREKASVDFKKRLSYPIKKHQEAFCLNFNFLLTGQLISQLNQRLNLEKDILRHLINLKQKPKSKSLREDADYQIADKIKPLIAQEVPLPKKAAQDKKVKIEELDKKLKEILKQ